MLAIVIARRQIQTFNYSGSDFGAIQWLPHPVFAGANTPLSLPRRGVGGEVE